MLDHWNGCFWRMFCCCCCCFNSMGSTLPLTFRKRLKSVGKQCQWTASLEMGKAVKNRNIYYRGKKQMEQCCKWTEAQVKTKSYLSLPLFRFWLNVGLNHSCSSPAVMGWEWSQDMVLTTEVPVCSPSHLLLSPGASSWLLFWCQTVSDHFKGAEDGKRIHL